MAWLALFPAVAAYSQAGSDPVRGLEIASVLRGTLASNPDIQLAVQQAEASRGALVGARAPFDLQLQSDALTSRVHTLDPLLAVPTVQNQSAYGVGAQRLFRNGITVTPEVRLTRTAFSTRPGEVANNASVALTLTLPLLRDRGGAVSAAPERAAAHDYRSSLLGVRQTISQRVLSAAVAYWNYLSAQRRLEATRASEERAQRTADETRVLVKAEERTPADLTQILGTAAAKRVSRIAAEQTVVEARQLLGLAIGLPADEILRLPEPATGFPVITEGPAVRLTEAQLLETADKRRADLAAAEEQIVSARTLLESSRKELQPRLDVVLGTGYGATETGQSLEDFVSPLYRHGPRLDGSVGIRFQFPGANSSARGRLAQNASVLEQQRVLKQDLARRISTGVSVAVEALARGEAGMRESAEAVRLLQSTLLAEERKFQLGVSTLFDVIQAQDGLTNALLGQIQSQRDYAAAIATLRFQSGTLLSGEGESVTVEVNGLLTPP